MRRLVAAVSLAALGLSLTVPLVSAHEERYVHEFAWTTSPAPSTANDRAEVYSNDELVAARIYMSDGVKSWDVVIRPVNGGQPSTCHEDLALEGNRYPTQVYINCPWDTTRAKNHILPGPTPHSVATKQGPTTPDEPRRTWQSQDLGPSVNGKYTIEITAVNGKCPLVTNCSQGEVHSLYQSGSNPPRWREVFVTNSVAQPAGVSSAYDPGTNKVAVSWAPNPEPDVSYVVQEKVGDGKWSSGVAVGNATRYERAVDPGTYQYRVAAERPAPTRDNGNAMTRSEFVAAGAVQATPPAPPSTAGSTHGPDGVVNGGGGDPGVVGPRDDTPPSSSAPGTPGKTGSGPVRGTSPARPGSVPTGGARPSGGFSRPTGSTAPAFGEAEGEGPDEGFSSVLPYTEPRQGFVDDLGEDEEEEVAMIPGAPVPQPRDTRALLLPMAAGLALFVLAMQGVVFFRRRPALAGNEDHYDDFDDWLRY